MTTIIFDFDDTLYNNLALRKDVVKTFGTFGIPEAEVESTYKNVRHLYNYEKHVEAINALRGKTENDLLLSALYSLPFHTYTFEKIQDILKELKEKHRLILLTFGDAAFQTHKLDASGIKEYFHEVIITQKHKKDALADMGDLGDEVYFINDKETENLVIQESFPHFRVLHITPENPVHKINWEI